MVDIDTLQQVSIKTVRVEAVGPESTRIVFDTFIRTTGSSPIES
jgi:hypothetical protein